MHWKHLTHPEQLDEIQSFSFSQVQYIFKHSTRCSISTVAKSRLEKSFPENCSIYYLDLLAYRNISNQIAGKWNIVHESPQLLKIENGVCTFHANHLEIKAEDLA